MTHSMDDYCWVSIPLSEAKSPQFFMGVSASLLKIDGFTLHKVKDKGVVCYGQFGLVMKLMRDGTLRIIFVPVEQTDEDPSPEDIQVVIDAVLDLI